MAEVAEDLSSLTRDELNERAEEAGVESPEDLSSKADVIDAINEAEGNEPEDDEDGEEAAEPEHPEGDVANIPDEELEGETPAPVQPDSHVILGDTDVVPEEVQGHPAYVVNVYTEEDEDGDEVQKFDARSRDEHNTLVTGLTTDDVSEVFRGSEATRGFGP